MRLFKTLALSIFQENAKIYITCMSVFTNAYFQLIFKYVVLLYLDNI